LRKWIIDLSLARQIAASFFAEGYALSAQTDWAMFAASSTSSNEPLSALSAGVGVGLDKLGAFGALGIGGNSFLQRAAQGVLTNAVTQGAAVATGLQKKFDWAGVAAAGIATSVAGWAADKLGGRLSPGATGFVARSAGSLVSAAARSLIEGTSFGDNVLMSLPDVLGTTIGNAVASKVRGAGRSGPASSSQGANATANTTAYEAEAGLAESWARLDAVGADLDDIGTALLLTRAGDDPARAIQLIKEDAGLTFEQATASRSLEGTLVTNVTLEGGGYSGVHSAVIEENKPHWNRDMSSFGQLTLAYGTDLKSSDPKTAYWVEDQTVMAKVNAQIDATQQFLLRTAFAPVDFVWGGYNVVTRQADIGDYFSVGGPIVGGVVAKGTSILIPAIRSAWGARGRGAASGLPKFTFRGDSRLESEIFRDGFAPRGTSTDLMAHALDNTLPPSAFVSSSRSLNVAAGFANNVYVLRPTNGIDVNRVLGPASPFPLEQEIAIFGKVAPSDIRAVTRPSQGVSILNPGYKPR
jgi:hypothetical protein